MNNPVEKLGLATVIRVQGRLDVITSPEFEQQCSGLLAQGEKLLVADLGAVAYVSSAGLRSVLATAKKLKAVQGKLALCGLQPMVEQVFLLSGFSSFIPICKTLDEAIAEVGK